MSATIPAVGMAFLNVIAIGEDINPADYDELCGGGKFSDFSHFPQWDGWHNPKTGAVSHAAGRYQFEPRTFADVAARIGLTDFTPDSQDHAAWELAGEVYKAHTGRDLGSDLAAGQLDGVVPALQPTWPSLSAATFATRFAAALKERTAGSPPIPTPEAAPTPVPPPTPSPPPPPKPAPIPPVSPGIGVGVGGTASAALAQVLVWLSHWPLTPLDGPTALSLASLVLGALGIYWHVQSKPKGGG
jgi:muramidase (phage lysozyme)